MAYTQIFMSHSNALIFCVLKYNFLAICAKGFQLVGDFLLLFFGQTKHAIYSMAYFTILIELYGIQFRYYILRFYVSSADHSTEYTFQYVGLLLGN